MKPILRFLLARAEIILLIFFATVTCLYIEGCTSKVNDWLKEPIPYSVDSSITHPELPIEAVLLHRHVNATISTPYELYLLPSNWSTLEDGSLIMKVDRVWGDIEFGWSQDDSPTLRVTAKAQFWRQLESVEFASMNFKVQYQNCKDLH